MKNQKNKKYRYKIQIIRGFRAERISSRQIHYNMETAWKMRRVKSLTPSSIGHRVNHLLFHRHLLTSSVSSYSLLEFALFNELLHRVYKNSCVCVTIV